jgi:(2Fe-2S) ferredoxin
MAGVEVLAAGCLGQCGSGPNVVVQLPDKNPFWYMGIWPEAVPVIVQQHLKQGLPVWELLSCSKHPHARRDYGPAPEGLFTKVRTLLGLG